MANWYYRNEKGEKISVTSGQLKGLAQAGLITPETIIETECGKSEPARKVQGLTFAETIQPEASPLVVAASNKFEVAKIGWMSAHNVLKTAAQQGNPEAMFYLGYYFQHGHLHDGNKGEKNEQAAYCFTQGAKFATQGSAAGLCCAGLCSEFGLGVTKDDLAAVKHYEKAAEKGFAFAYLCLAHAYSAGGEFIEKDLKEATAYSSMAFKQLMQECQDEKEAIELVAMQCNYSLNSGDLGNHLNIESSKCPKEFRKAFEACLEHFNRFLEVANQAAALNQQYVDAIGNINSGAGNAVVDGVADALGGRRWMFDLKGGAVDAGISLLTNAVSGAIKTNQARAALDENYQNEFNKLDKIRKEIGARIKESANRVQKIANRHGVVFNCFDSIVEHVIVEQVMPVRSSNVQITHSSWANYEGNDGRLTLTPDALIFQAHNPNVQAKKLTIPLEQCHGATTNNSFGIITNGLRIVMKNDEAVCFLVSGRKSWVEKIQKAIIRLQSGGKQS